MCGIASNPGQDPWEAS